MLIACVIPCYKVIDHIIEVIGSIGPEVSRIYVIDDACPEGSGDLVERNFANSERVVVLRHEQNKGVGGAVITGYLKAIEEGFDIIVKLDGDGQIPGELIPALTAWIIAGEADYVKGNRFYSRDSVNAMPKLRLIGNAGLSFMTKLSSGYWQIFDPTNGFTAIHSEVAKLIDFSKVSNRFFFESDMLFRLYTVGAVVADFPMNAKYEDETSNLKISSVILEFVRNHCKNTVKRICYRYFLRDFSAASISLVLGSVMLLFGLVYGLTKWLTLAIDEAYASAGTVMIAALPTILGVQLLLNFLSFDVSATPTRPIHPIGKLRRNYEPRQNADV